MPCRLKSEWTCTLEGWSLIVNLILLISIVSAAHTKSCTTLPSILTVANHQVCQHAAGPDLKSVFLWSSQRNISSRIWVYGLKGKTRPVLHCYESCTLLFLCLKSALGCLQHSSDLPKCWGNTFCHLHVSHQQTECKQVHAWSIQSYGKYRLIVRTSYSFRSQENNLELVLYTFPLWCPALKRKGPLKIRRYSCSKGTTEVRGSTVGAEILLVNCIFGMEIDMLVPDLLAPACNSGV